MVSATLKGKEKRMINPEVLLLEMAHFAKSVTRINKRIRLIVRNKSSL
jgi:hypothetical protein